MFNSVCGEQQPHPARHEAGMEKTRAPNIQRPPGHGTPRRTTAGTTAASTQKRAEEGPKAGTSDSHSVGAPGCRGGKPAGSTGSRPSQGGPGPGPGDPKGPPPHNRGPARPVGPGPANDRREWAGARPSILPRREKSPTHRRHHPPAGHGGGVGSTKMMSEAESKARPDT